MTNLTTMMYDWSGLFEHPWFEEISYWSVYNAVARLFLNTFGIVFLYILYVGWCFKEWEKHMSGQRVTRRNKSSPSNLKLPDMKRMSENKQRIVENSKFHELFDDCELINSMFGLKETKRRNSLFRERAMRTISLTPGKLASLRGSVMGSLNMVEPAKELDMDHVYVGFFDFLWAYTFIGPCSYYLWKKGTLMLRLRDYLSSNGYITPAPCDYESMCATLLLEQTQAIHYYARTNPDSERGNVAGFYFANFPYVDENCEYRVADLFAVEIDLDTKKFVDGKLDDLVLNASETMILLWFNTIAAQHVKLHSTANWGLNLDETLEDVNPFFRRNSVVTVMYNFFGYTCFNRFMRIWADEGMVSEGWANEDKPFVQCVNHGIEDNVWQHSQIKELVKYSDFIHFVVSVRAIFMSEFAKCKHMFPGTDGEAMFVGTVLHSLDHTLMDWNMVDPLWLDVDDPRFGKMAEVGRVVKAGFVSDVPGLYFHKRFKGSGHPFYETVYAKAAKINKKLADHMDTCIIK